jgi:hypothetical protein
LNGLQEGDTPESANNFAKTIGYGSVFIENLIVIRRNLIQGMNESKNGLVNLLQKTLNQKVKKRKQISDHERFFGKKP